MIYKLIKRLNRYSTHAIDHALDRDFAEAVDQAKTELADLRNELWLRFGNYRQKHLGACSDCRWRDDEGD